MMLRLAEGLRLPLGPDDFADYARAMEAARAPCRSPGRPDRSAATPHAGDGQPNVAGP